MGRKLFFEKDGEICRTIKHWKCIMRERGLTQLHLFEAKIVYGESFFWCSWYQEVGDRDYDRPCGRSCEKYTPRNGKSGRCVHHKNTYEPTDRKITLKL